MHRRRFLVFAGLFPAAAWAQPQTKTAKLIASARAQVGRTVLFDPAYVKLSYPGGDVPIERGVCTDVVIRAYRDAFGIDLQKRVYEDMRQNFSAYPAVWGLKRPDRNIDHRRVPNLQVFFTRFGKAFATRDETAYAPGDLVTMMLPRNLPHIGIVSDEKNTDGVPLIVHNIGRGTQEEDLLKSYPITGHYRYALI